MRHILLILLVILCLTGCAVPEGATDREVVSFTYQNIQIALHAEAESIIAALGEPKSYTEEASCAFEGLDKTYYYGPFYLTTYPREGKDYISTLWFADDTVATDEGIRIGSTQAQVEAAYGAEVFNGTNAYVLIKGTGKLTVVITDGVVSGIRYEGIME